MSEREMERVLQEEFKMEIIKNEFLEEVENLPSHKLVSMLTDYVDQHPETNSGRTKAAAVELGRRASGLRKGFR